MRDASFRGGRSTWSYMCRICLDDAHKGLLQAAHSEEIKERYLFSSLGSDADVFPPPKGKKQDNLGIFNQQRL